MKIEGYRYGGEIAKWLSEFLEVENLDLVNFGSNLEPRKLCLIDKKLESRKEEIIYSDDSPFLLISESSLNDLNSRLKEKVSMRNFRPNFVVKDVVAAYDEVILIENILNRLNTVLAAFLVPLRNRYVTSPLPKLASVLGFIIF